MNDRDIQQLRNDNLSDVADYIESLQGFQKAYKDCEYENFCLKQRISSLENANYKLAALMKAIADNDECDVFEYQSQIRETYLENVINLNNEVSASKRQA